MTQQQTPRVWTLDIALIVPPADGLPIKLIEACGSGIASDETVVVIEAEPVAELLERTIPFMPHEGTMIDEAQALLRTLRTP